MLILDDIFLYANFSRGVNIGAQPLLLIITVRVNEDFQD